MAGKLCHPRNGCGKLKPLCDFYPCPNGKLGLTVNCKGCLKIYNQKRYFRRCTPTAGSNGRMMYLLGVSISPTIFKFGSSCNPARRAKDLQANGWYKVILLKTWPDVENREVQVHKALTPYRIPAEHAREWYAAESPEAMIEKIEGEFS